VAEAKRCEQCGRTGTRGFKTTPAGVATTSVGEVAYPEFTECANRDACRKRWPKTRDEDDD